MRPCEGAPGGRPSLPPGWLTLQAGTGRVSSCHCIYFYPKPHTVCAHCWVLHWRPPDSSLETPGSLTPLRWALAPSDPLALALALALATQVAHGLYSLALPPWLKPLRANQASLPVSVPGPAIPGLSPFAPTQAVFADPASPFRLRVASALVHAPCGGPQKGVSADSCDAL